jgi:chorismate-pyruvate lyase
MPESLAAPPASATAPGLFPLDELYALAGLPMPRIQLVTGDDVPPPYQALLVHTHDMTPTLEGHHGSAIHIEVLRRQRRGDFYFREVVLRLDRDLRPVEFGANRVCLPLFSAELRRLILEEHLPLGHLLKTHNVPHRSFPKCFLRVEADDLINRALGLQGRHILYGRQARILNLRGQPLSEVVEILPPLAPGS